MKKNNLKLLKHIAITLLFPTLAVQFYSGGIGGENCLSFDVIGNRVLVPNSASLNLGAVGSGYTIECWVKPTNVIGDQYRIAISKAPTHAGNMISFYTQITTAGKMDFAVHDGIGNYYFATSTTILIQNNWYHVVGTRNGSSLLLYINGVQEAITAIPDIDYRTTAQVGIGNEEVRNDYPWKGEIDEVRIWNTARTGTEIRNNMCQRLKGNENGLVGYWHFDEASGNTVYDASGNGNNGTLY